MLNPVTMHHQMASEEDESDVGPLANPETFSTLASLYENLCRSVKISYCAN
jgi:hypothetical protein